MLSAVALGLRRFHVDGRAILAAEVFGESVAWQAPPIVTSVSLLNEVGTFFGVQDVFDRVPDDLALKVYRFTLKDIQKVYDPSQIVGAFGLEDEAPLIFSHPEPWADTAEVAACFAVEFVQYMSMCNSSPIHVGPNDCWTIIADNECGVRDGKVLGSRLKVESLDLLLTLPRGRIWETKTLNVIDRMAAWVDVHGSSLPPELAGIRDILTILRFTSTVEERAWLEDMLAVGLKQERLPTVLKERRSGPRVRHGHREKIISAMKELDNPQSPDSVRVFKVMNLLVPNVISQSTFNTMFVNMRERKISVLQQRTMERMRKSLQKLLEAYDSKE